VFLRTFRSALLSAVVFAAASNVALAQTKAAGGPTSSPAGAMVYFIDVKNGQTITPKTILHFGLRGMGLAPAGVDRPNSGHHHLLIDSELPPLDAPIPNDFNHLHFGNGQTEAEVSLSPGEHTLQLLLGDMNHIPHSPAVMSERITVRVAEGAPAPSASTPPAPGGRHASAPNAKVYFVQPSDGGYVTLKPTIRFGLIGMGIAPAGVDKANTGHHHLIVDAALPPVGEPIPTDFNHLHFGAGQTEAQITLTPGRHTLQLLLGDASHVPHDPPVFSKPITVIASESGRRPVRHIKKHPRYRRWSYDD
jgi:hypothetical protein